MQREYEWHGITFTVECYFESGPGIDPNEMRFDIIKTEITDREEASLWWHGIPFSHDDWRDVERAAINDIAEWAQDDYDTDQRERADERAASEYESRRGH